MHARICMKEGSSNAKMTDEAKAVAVITGGRKYAEFSYLSVRHLTVIGRVLAKNVVICQWQAVHAGHAVGSANEKEKKMHRMIIVVNDCLFFFV